MLSLASSTVKICFISENQVVILTERDTIYCIKYFINKRDATVLLKYRTEELMQTSLSHRCQFLLFKLLF